MSPEEILLMHGETPYDPAKAHEYYLRTRELKGRQKGAEQETSGRSGGKVIPLSSKAPPKKKTALKSEARAAELQKRLTRLRKVLAELVKQAKGRSGVSSKDKKDSGGSGKSGGASKLSATEKREAAKRSKEYYKKHKDDAPDVKELKAKIEEVKKKIKEMRAELAAARAKSKKRTPDSVGVANNNQK